MPTLLPLWRKARRVSSAASRLPGTTSLRFALHGWQRLLRYCYCNASIIAKFLVWVSVVRHGWPLLGRAHVNFSPLSALSSAFVHRCRDFFAREGLRATFGFFMVFLRKQ
ncbi:MAG: hypothetical protein JMN24_13870 [gamma proteobacterium endosymbiont of Lamellibrachia anaximandri]|nr:hypothetical protein [gamma proteobacterium endosymbiont of Lamellibrachia anaximandri]